MASVRSRISLYVLIVCDLTQTFHLRSWHWLPAVSVPSASNGVRYDMLDMAIALPDLSSHLLHQP